MTFHAAVLTLYPEMFPGPLGVSLAGRALGEGKWTLDPVQIRDFAADKHRTVDDTPAGGGAGMVLRVDVLAKAIDHARGLMAQKILPEAGRGTADEVGGGGVSAPDAALEDANPLHQPAAGPPPRAGEAIPVIAMTPRGRPLTQARVRELAAGPGVIVVCGRFEGFDERIFEGRQVEEVSVGDIILSGGECAALMLLDACIRLLPGVMGAASSGHEESFENGLLEYPHYTRPQEWEGRTIPQVLRSGDHAKIAEWRQRQSEDDTRLRRPDLWERHVDARAQSASGARQKSAGRLKNEPDSAA
ncbi:MULTISPECIES: tRNA (guanosine(37)-N1)-methyltransferase TrmD [unclassified Novosphingobium]|uniref:tRNA (guanosine(37)-N1)-methyltransferase TrmD n=1 Tax=unclassified Novosphingobium TaxID=2644732 RepID=UPI00146AA01C|nr:MULTISPECIES: tRNA (guanosine(37)-N1)-methyltransferase TrmD [unclassified Novosphingobium]NMN06127.1 tRNA (guanine37-N1)-methyltransferase [Novosphingobium sp. SG919]NMN88424.1 tRNA (guanine37-N1)-methyltransferase [Novosphingobium sp. SG916]